MFSVALRSCLARVSGSASELQDERSALFRGRGAAGVKVSDRRSAARVPRRTEVRYWIAGDPVPRLGYTKDISWMGVYVLTRDPAEPGTNILVEIKEGERAKRVPGVVARRLRIRQGLGRLGQSGMGVRYLTPEEPVSRIETQANPLAGAVTQEEGVFRLSLDVDRRLLDAYSRALQLGGLFVPTPAPRQVGEEVTVEFQPPEEDEPIRAKATVVQTMLPGHELGRLPAGMAVTFDEPEEVVDRVRRYLDHN